jgi:hypothetical protein
VSIGRIRESAIAWVVIVMALPVTAAFLLPVPTPPPFWAKFNDVTDLTGSLFTKSGRQDDLGPQPIVRDRLSHTVKNLNHCRQHVVDQLLGFRSHRLEQRSLIHGEVHCRVDKTRPKTFER